VLPQVAGTNVVKPTPEPRLRCSSSWLSRTGGPVARRNLKDDEIEPRVVSATKPDRVVWSTLWPSRPNDQVHFELTAVASETLLRFTLLTPDDPPVESKTGDLRRRLNQLLFAELRFSYGQ
jgi:hypothetical protein